MKHRDVWKVIVFAALTLGIYLIFWLDATRKELIARGQKIPGYSILYAPFIGILISLLIEVGGYFYFPKSPDSLGLGIALPDIPGWLDILSTVIGVISGLAVLPLTIYWFYMYCKAVNVVTNGKMSVGLSLSLFFILNIALAGIIWPAIIQDALNGVDEVPPAPILAGSPPESPAQPAPPTAPTPPAQVS